MTVVVIRTGLGPWDWNALVWVESERAASTFRAKAQFAAERGASALLECIRQHDAQTGQPTAWECEQREGPTATTTEGVRNWFHRWRDMPHRTCRFRAKPRRKRGRRAA